MNRRKFVVGLGGAAAWPVVAGAQQPAVPVIGFLDASSPEQNSHLVAAFREGLSETGFLEGRNVAIEYRWGLSEVDRLPEMAADLVRRRVAVIATPGSTPASLAAKAATATIPIVFGVGADPVQTGLVTNFRRPGGNITGYSEMNTEVGTKRFGLLHDLVPHATRFGLLGNPRNPTTAFAVSEAQAAAATLGVQIEVLAAANDRDIDTVFASLAQRRVEALVGIPDPLFGQRRDQVIVLAARYAVPAVYWDPEFPKAGGLISYGSRVADGYRQIGIYTGRILKGEKPGNLPVLQPTKFELAISRKTAKALGLTIPPDVLAIADEVIE